MKGDGGQNGGREKEDSLDKKTFPIQVIDCEFESRVFLGKELLSARGRSHGRSHQPRGGRALLASFWPHAERGFSEDPSDPLCRPEWGGGEGA